jgi:hypothetical protein
MQLWIDVGVCMLTARWRKLYVRPHVGSTEFTPFNHDIPMKSVDMILHWSEVFTTGGFLRDDFKQRFTKGFPLSIKRKLCKDKRSKTWVTWKTTPYGGDVVDPDGNYEDNAESGVHGEVLISAQAIMQLQLEQEEFMCEVSGGR